MLCVCKVERVCVCMFMSVRIHMHTHPCHTSAGTGIDVYVCIKGAKSFLKYPSP